jgi:hypothetical protein
MVAAFPSFFFSKFLYIRIENNQDSFYPRTSDNHLRMLIYKKYSRPIILYSQTFRMHSQFVHNGQIPILWIKAEYHIDYNLCLGTSREGDGWVQERLKSPSNNLLSTSVPSILLCPNCSGSSSLQDLVSGDFERKSSYLCLGKRLDLWLNRTVGEGLSASSGPV